MSTKQRDERVLRAVQCIVIDISIPPSTLGYTVDKSRAAERIKRPEWWARG